MQVIAPGESLRSICFPANAPRSTLNASTVPRSAQQQGKDVQGLTWTIITPLCSGDVQLHVWKGVILDVPDARQIDSFRLSL